MRGSVTAENKRNVYDYDEDGHQYSENETRLKITKQLQLQTEHLLKEEGKEYHKTIQGIQQLKKFIKNRDDE